MSGDARTYRNRGVGWGGAAFALLFGVPLLVLGLDAHSARGGLLAFGAAGLLVSAVRLARSGLVLDDEGVTVRGVFRTRAVRWDEVAEFAGVPNRNGGEHLVVRCTDGTVLRAEALSTSNPGGPWATHVLAALEAARAEHPHR